MNETIARPENLTADSSPITPRDRGVTARVVVLCLALAVAFGYVIPLIDVKMGNTYLGATHLPPGAIGVLLVLLLVVNPLLGLLSKRGRFSRNETLVVYISCLFSCLVPGHGAENLFVSNLVGPFYFSTRENGWLELLGPNLKPWFTPALSNDGLAIGGNALVQSWYTGASSGGYFVPWGAWLVPLLAWGSLILASYWMLACLSVMLRAQWAEREALSFPLLRLPLEMTEDAANNGGLPEFFRSSVMWVGFGMAFFVQLVRGLHLYFPDVPTIPLELDLTPFFSEAPWNQIGSVPLQIFPIVVGVAFLLTSEISFSVWVFFWFIKLQLIAAYLTGFQPSTLPTLAGSSDKLFTSMQVVGAMLAWVAVLMWIGREHLQHIVRRSFGREKATQNEQGEALSYPVAFWGFVFGLVFCVGWCIAAGVTPVMALFMWALYIVVAIGLTRAVVEGGVLFVQHGWVPLVTFANLFNSGPSTMLPLSSIVPGTFVQSGLMTDLRGFLMPSFLQGFKLAKDRGIAARPLMALIGAVTVIGLTMGILMNVRLGHQNGGLTLEWWFAQGSPQQNVGIISTLARGMSDQGAIGTTNWFWMGVGATVTIGMIIARSRFSWFLLHPIGYVLCSSYAMQKLWFSVLLGWLFKTLINRFGGSDAYRASRPLFLGLALGDIVAMLFWLIIDGWFARTGHQLMPA